MGSVPECPDRLEPGVIEVRLLRPEEWSFLFPIFDAEGAKVPSPTTSFVAAAFDGPDLVGFWVAQAMIHAGPLWIRPDRRGSGLWRKLSAALEGQMTSRPGAGYYSFSAEPKVEAIFQKLGYREMPYKVWAKEV